MMPVEDHAHKLAGRGDALFDGKCLAHEASSHGAVGDMSPIIGDVSPTAPGRFLRRASANDAENEILASLNPEQTTRDRDLLLSLREHIRREALGNGRYRGASRASIRQ